MKTELSLEQYKDLCNKGYYCNTSDNISDTTRNLFFAKKETITNRLESVINLCEITQKDCNKPELVAVIKELVEQSLEMVKEL